MKKRAGFGNEKGVAVLVALFLLVLFSFLLLAIAHQISATSLGTVQMRYKDQTENFAMGGMQHLVACLTRNPTATTCPVNYAGFDAYTPDPVDSTFTGAMITFSQLQALTPPASYHALSQDILLTAAGRRKADGVTEPDATTLGNEENATFLHQRHRRGSYIDSLDASGTSDWQWSVTIPATYAPVEAMDGDLDTNVDHGTTPIETQINTTGSGSWRSNGAGTGQSIVIDFGMPLACNAIRWFQTRMRYIYTASVDRWDDATQTWIEIANNTANPLPWPADPSLYVFLPMYERHDYLKPYYDQGETLNVCDGGCHPNIWRGRGITLQVWGSFNGTSGYVRYHFYSDLDFTNLDNNIADGEKWSERNSWCLQYCSPPMEEIPTPEDADYIAFIAWPEVTTRAIRFRITGAVGPAGQADISILGVYHNQGELLGGDTNPSGQNQAPPGTPYAGQLESLEHYVNLLWAFEGHFRPEGRRE